MMTPFSLRARYVFPVDGPPIANGVVTIAAERIVSVGRSPAGPPPIDLGNVALLPGLVNAHAHLEFSNLRGPLGEAGMSLPAWIDEVIAWRVAHGDDRPVAIARGISESLASGTALIGEIATGTAADYRAVASRIGMTCFWETIAPRSADRDAALQAAERWISGSTTAAPDWQCGLSPHAPYTVDPDTVDQLARLSALRQVPVAMHLAESPEEVELLATGRGPLRQLLEGGTKPRTKSPAAGKCGAPGRFCDGLLEARSAWEPRTFARPQRPLDYLRRLAVADRSLVIHGNYLRQDEWEFLAERSDRMTLVFCPRTHAFFRHARYPLPQTIALGVRMAVGTDGRSSNPDLNLLGELDYLARHFPEVAPAKVVEMGTLDGARALGRHGTHGSISPGKWANLVGIAWPEQRFADPHEGIFCQSPRVVSRWCRGHLHP